MNKYSDRGMIGITPIAPKLVDNITDSSILPRYAEFEIKRLTKASSFMIGDEVIYVCKKSPNGKPSKLYNFYRMSDKRYICPSVLDKLEAIKMVTIKYIKYMKENK